ncbi:MAG: EsaB/YukD family protein [Anaerolineales bacterium]|nr:EsaB/YukD family protein [Anaerolineales bacterium]MCW5854827.1 EsaB/YukD family protein [Anaerolineales bacterium]
MNKIIIGILLGSNKHPAELEIRANIPIRELILPIQKFLDCPANDADGQPFQYWLTTLGGEPLNQNLSLEEAGIKNSMTLILHQGSKLPKEVTQKPEDAEPLFTTTSQRNSERARQQAVQQAASLDPQERRKTPSVPASWKKIRPSG